MLEAHRIFPCGNESSQTKMAEEYYWAITRAEEEDTLRASMFQCVTSFDFNWTPPYLHMYLTICILNCE